MLGFGKVSGGRAAATASAPGGSDERIYDDYADRLYQQALLTLGDVALAEQVVCDVLVEECVGSPPAASADDARRRLAVAAYRRCQALADRRQRRDQHAQQCPLSPEERGALGLVLFGGLGYVQASRVLAVSPLDVAALLRAVLHKLAARSSLAYPAPLSP